MACAVAMPCPASVPKFQGDEDGLVDRLVAACEAAKHKVAANVPLKERELEPFCFDEAPPLPACNAKASQRSPAKGRSPRSSPPKKAKASTPSRSRGAQPAAQTPSRVSFDGGMTRSAKPSPAHFQSLGDADDLARVLRGMPASPALPVAACPGFFSSPRPTDLPMPSGLLARVAVKA